MNQSGGTERQLRARASYRPSQNFLNSANQSLLAGYQFRPDSSFSQVDLDRFNRRQDEARGNLSRTYGEQYLEPVQRYDRVEDIPRYTQQELDQQKMERLKANPKSFYNRQNTPLNQRFNQGNQKVPQNIVDNYNSVIGKFRNLAETGDQSSIGFQDFQPLLDSLKNSPAEYIQPGEKYEGPAFENIDGSLQRDDPSSIFYQGGGSTQPSRSQPAAPSYKSQNNPMPNGRSDRGNYSRTPIARETATSTPTRRSFNPDLAAPSETAASTPTRRDNPRRRNRRQREMRVEANARANRRNRGPVDASTRSNRRAQRERAVIDRQRGGRGRRGGGLRGGGGRRGARARGAAQ